MSYFEHTPQHRVDSSVVEQRRMFAGTVVDAATLPALRRANQRLRRRRLTADALFGSWVAMLIVAIAFLILGLIA